MSLDLSENSWLYERYITTRIKAWLGDMDDTKAKQEFKHRFGHSLRIKYDDKHNRRYTVVPYTEKQALKLSIDLWSKIVEDAAVDKGDYIKHEMVPANCYMCDYVLSCSNSNNMDQDKCKKFCCFEVWCGDNESWYHIWDSQGDGTAALRILECLKGRLDELS